MTAVAGPGPSTTEAAYASPVSFSRSPGSFTRKRGMVLVNPADPSDFEREKDVKHRLEMRSSASGDMLEAPVMGTPLAVRNLQREGVKGILRESGTPGSGNGVRFFPKNRFRVITPNHSLHMSTEPARKSPSTSFLSQLLSVVPAMSPRRSLSDTLPRMDESWEVPGQEGEVSLVASSTTSCNQSGEYDDEGEVAEEEGEPWSGQPTIHSSPLGLAVDPPEDEISELVSQEMLVPEDMSDLMTEKLNMSGIPSFSVAQSKPDGSPMTASGHSMDASMDGVSFLQTLRPNRVAQPPPRQETGAQASGSQIGDTDSPVPRNIVLQRNLLSSPAPLAARPSSPITPVKDSKPFRSIFADMSAEQADLSWPLIKASPDKASVDNDEPSRPIVEKVLQSPPARAFDTSRAGNKSGFPNTPGNGTAFFDCSSATPSPVFPASSSVNSLELRTPSPLVYGLIEPTKAVFDAHSAHAAALSNELTLYQRLVTSLQDEVSQRDSVLADLNIRALEAEVWRTKCEELEAEVDQLRRSDSNLLDKLHLADEQTPSPTPVRVASFNDGNRTTIAESFNRDLEIRLSKAMSDLAIANGKAAQVQMERDDARAERDELQKLYADKERDGSVAQLNSDRKTNEELREQLEVVSKRERALHAQLAESMDQSRIACAERDAAQSQREEWKKRASMDEHAIALRDDEISQLKESSRRIQLDARAEKNRFSALIEDLQRESQDHSSAFQAVQRELREARDAKLVSEEKARELQRDLLIARKESALASLSTRSDPHELARLRSESATKDLEIAALHRRKAELKEDLEMLNIALDSKQQELELVKRRFAVRGIAGSTPLVSSSRISSSTNNLPEVMETPAPFKAPNPRMNRRLSSMTLVTPSLGNHNGRMLRSKEAGSRMSLKTGSENLAPDSAVSTRQISGTRRERTLVPA